MHPVGWINIKHEGYLGSPCLIKARNSGEVLSLQNPRGSHLPNCAEDSLFFTTFIFLFIFPPSVSIKEIKNLEKDRKIDE